MEQCRCSILGGVHYHGAEGRSASRICNQDVWAWLGAALDAERITTMVTCGGHLGAAHDVQRE